MWTPDREPIALGIILLVFAYLEASIGFAIIGAIFIISGFMMVHKPLLYSICAIIGAAIFAWSWLLGH